MERVMSQILGEVGEPHVTLSCERVVECEGGAQRTGAVSLCGYALVFAQQRAVVGVRAVVYYLLRSPCRTLSSEVGYALFGYYHVHVVLGGVYVAAHWDYRADFPALGCRGRVEYAYRAVALVVARPSDAVHQP